MSIFTAANIALVLNVIEAAERIGMTVAQMRSAREVDITDEQLAALMARYEKIKRAHDNLVMDGD